MSSDLEPSISAFLEWMHAHARALRRQPASKIADRLTDKLLAIHPQLGLEVAQGVALPREVIITSFSDPTLFPMVRCLVAALGDIPGWTFVALKPPRGFAFTITLDGKAVSARDFRFVPLSYTAGITLLPPEGANAPNGDTEELGWLIVETGVGEELASALQHVEISEGGSQPESRPIAELGPYIEQHWLTAPAGQ